MEVQLLLDRSATCRDLSTTDRPDLDDVLSESEDYPKGHRSLFSDIHTLP